MTEPTEAQIKRARELMRVPDADLDNMYTRSDYAVDVAANLIAEHEAAMQRVSEIAEHAKKTAGDHWLDLAAILDELILPDPTPTPEQVLAEAPIPMILHCPECRGRHIDEGVFADKPHHTHACQHCGMVWRPAKVDTCGVQFLPGYSNVAPIKDTRHD